MSTLTILTVTPTSAISTQKPQDKVLIVEEQELKDFTFCWINLSH